MSYTVEKKIEFSSSLTGQESATNIEATYGDGHDQYRVRFTGHGGKFQFYLQDEEMDGLLEAIRELNTKMGAKDFRPGDKVMLLRGVDPLDDNRPCTVFSRHETKLGVTYRLEPNGWKPKEQESIMGISGKYLRLVEAAEVAIQNTHSLNNNIFEQAGCTPIPDSKGWYTHELLPFEMYESEGFIKLEVNEEYTITDRSIPATLENLQSLIKAFNPTKA